MYMVLLQKCHLKDLRLFQLNCKAINFSDEKFIVWGSGNQRRAFLYVDDVIDGILSTLDKGLNKGVIQIGPSESTSIKEIAKKVVQLSGKEIQIFFDKNLEGDKDRTADISKAKKIINWNQSVSIDDGLEKTFSWAVDYFNKKLVQTIK